MVDNNYITNITDRYFCDDLNQVVVTSLVKHQLS